MEKMEKLSQAKRILTRPSNCEPEVCLSGGRALAWYAQALGSIPSTKQKGREAEGRGKGRRKG